MIDEMFARLLVYIIILIITISVQILYYKWINHRCRYCTWPRYMHNKKEFKFAENIVCKNFEKIKR